MSDTTQAMRDAELTKLWREIQDTSISSGGEPHLRFARAIEAALSSTTGATKLEGCGDCDPCIGGREDQCAVGPIEVLAETAPQCLTCGDHGLIGAMTIEGGEGWPCPHCNVPEPLSMSMFASRADMDSATVHYCPINDGEPCYTIPEYARCKGCRLSGPSQSPAPQCAPSDLSAEILTLKPIDAPGLTGNHIRTHRGGFAAGLRAAAALVASKLKESRK